MDVVMRLPDVATVDDTVTLVKWLVEVGRSVRRGDPLLEVETDKAILVVESPISGTLNAVSVEPGRGGHRTGHRDIRRRGGTSAGPTSAGGPAIVPTLRTTPADRSRARRASSRGPGVGRRGGNGPGRAAIGGRRSFFGATARRGAGRTAGSPASDPSSYDRAFLMDLYRRMV